ncbi:MAG: family 43 glycosylhydrolase [Clostridia bacterium]|nr:family 43 glycosylhydrolase [Clostridia bacterium]
MKNSEINIRDPFILPENGVYYMYGTRANNFGRNVKGFDVYVSTDLENWSEPHECFNSTAYGFDREVNWAPEVHKYGGAYYMFATFTRETGLRGTYILKSDSPEGPFAPHSDGAVTPVEWECLDGTLYVEDGVPYMVFCHEHTQIINGTICYMPLTPDLKRAAGEPVYLFSGSDPFYVDTLPEGEHYVTDGPFMYRTSGGGLLMLWSTILKGRYAECIVKFSGGSIKNSFEHLDPIIDNDGGHGMIFEGKEGLYLTYHSPNRSGYEHPVFRRITEDGGSVRLL